MPGNILRNYAAALTSPTAWIGILLIIGIILLWTKKQKLAKWILTLGALLFVMFSFDPITEIFLNSYENRYPAFKVESLNPNQNVKYVVVLAGGFVPYPPLHPLTTALTRHTLARVIEGIKIHNEIENSILVFSGKGWSSQSEASGMKELALKLGVKSEKIILEEESTNTLGHTQYLKKLLNGEPFVLVTSAVHMPRAMGLFLKAGYKPIPAPTAHMLLGEYELFNMKVPFASGDNLEAIDLWFNEFAAIVRETIKGNI
jgi:uncharacterized SAM-binding protein YcdF (DUF218 family)